jgi:iron(III) transport system ATP-binding protein
MKAAPIRLEQVTKRFGREVVAVDKVMLEVEPGTLLTLLGPSGCGKTTTLRMIAGLERASEGKIFIDNEDVTNLPANLRDVTMVFQSYALFPHMNVFENVAYGLKVARRPQEEVKQRVLEALAMVGLEGLENRATNALSGGQQQRVALARALVLQPKVLLFDEPLSNLDAKLRHRVREEIRDLQQRLGITSVYVTHDQEEALAISDVIVVMNKGRIEQVGSPLELYTQPSNRFVADFIGSASFLNGHYDGETVTVGDYRFRHQQAIPAGDVTVMVRPEAVVLAAHEGLSAQVQSSSYLGAETDFLFETVAGEIMARIVGEGMMGLNKGDTTRIHFRPAGIHLLGIREVS